MKSEPQNEVYVDRYGSELGRLIVCPDCGGHLTLQWVNIPLPASRQVISLTTDPLCVDIFVSDDPVPMFWGDCAVCKKGEPLVLNDEVAQALFRTGPAITGEGDGGSRG
jgi:hypothetical protein